MAIVIWWTLLAAYLIGYAASLRPIAEQTLDNIVRSYELDRDQEKILYPRTYHERYQVGKVVPSASGRIRAVWYAAGKAIFWPIVIPVHLMARTVVTPTERLRESEKENARLRKLAADEGLDWPKEMQ